MNDNALQVSSGAPPGAPPSRLPDGVTEWHATTAFLQSTIHGLRTPAQTVSSILDDLLATIFPANCRVCGGSLLRAEFSPRNVPICNLCLTQLRPQSESLPSALCRICGEVLGMESDRFAANSPSEGLLCTPCRMVPPGFDRAVAYGVYQNELREMIHALKYDGIQSSAKPLAAKLAETIVSLEREEDWTGNFLVIAVPLFPAKQKVRGFNQAKVLAEAALTIVRESRPAWKPTARHDLLQRVKDTQSQFALSDKGRRRNLIGAFEVKDDSNALIGKTVLLVDDIYTTGATARACSGVLRRAGASRVWVATLARAQKEQVALWDSSAHDFG